MFQIVAIGAAAIALLLDLFSHRFQRATLAVSNLQTKGKASREETARLQMALMPDWVGTAALLEKAMAIIAAILLYFAFASWAVAAFAISYLLGLFAGIGGVFIPLMPYAWYLASIEKHLESSRLKLVAGQRLPTGATIDVVESMDLSRLTRELADESTTGKLSVEAIAAGRIQNQI